MDVISAHPLLTSQEERDLALTIRNGTAAEKAVATDRYVKSNLRLVASIAYGFGRYIKHVSIEDLIQEGSIGLMRGIEKFDPDRGYKFSTYASWWIRQAIMRASYQDHLIRTPIYQVEKQNQVRRIHRDILASRGTPPSVAEVAEAMEVSVTEVQKVLATFYNTVSLDSPVGEEDNGATVGDLLVDHEVENPEHATVTQDTVRALNELLEESVRNGTATQRDIDILRLRFDLDREGPKSLEDVGHQVGLTRERVRQILTRQLLRMRYSATSKFGR